MFAFDFLSNMCCDGTIEPYHYRGNHYNLAFYLFGITRSSLLNPFSIAKCCGTRSYYTKSHICCDGILQPKPLGFTAATDEQTAAISPAVGPKPMMPDHICAVVVQYGARQLILPHFAVPKSTIPHSSCAELVQ